MKQRKIGQPSPKKGNSTTCSAPPRCPIVAMGASAGGLEVFQQFFDHMPPESGMAFVLVQHLDPNHESLMPELLASHTTMKVVLASDGLKVHANHIYVIAPNVSLSMDGCTLKVAPLRSSADRKLIDQFFQSLAEDQHENVVGIIFSGTGFDGTAGLKAVKEQGGLTMAQSPDTAKFDSMPSSAISTGYVDYVLPVAEMPGRIVEYIKHLDLLHHRKGDQTLQEEVAKFLPRIFPILRKKTGHDFSRYKQSTLIRRVQRRMQVVYLNSVSKYVQYLRENPDEVEALFKDLLIGVTQFFRDAESFEVLARKVIPALFQEKGKESQVRVWIPGCASGEEAYSFAILLAEFAAQLESVPKIQVFASDLDVEALEFARKAKYPEDIANQVSPERLQKFFKKNGSAYEVIDQIREMCIFSPHNLIKDPPFSRLDLISCRNLLIYLEADLQRKLLPLFHYALNPCGFLFLGPSENIASRSELFRATDPKHRIFQRKPTLLHSPVHAPLIDQGRVTRLQTVAAPQISVPKELSLARSIERVILEEYAPASVIINEQGEVLYFSGNTGKYLEPPSGVPSNKIVVMARKNLRLELRTVVNRAISTGKEVIRENLALKFGREVQHINLIVRPLTELGKDAELFIVLFLELIPGTTAGNSHEDFAHHEHPIIKQLEGELRITKEDLQTTIEELETSNEELKSANEELLSMNEELQSGNEELQTSKEEIQSANEELQNKVEELDAALTHLRQAQEQRGQLAAIVEGSHDAIYGMTFEGNITSWNRAAERMYGYSADEAIGRNISFIVPADRMQELEGLQGKLKHSQRSEVLETVRRTKDDREILVSITWSAIRDLKGEMIGVSSIARDVTEKRKAEEELRRSNQRFTNIVESITDGFLVLDREWRLVYLNPRQEEIIAPLGKSRENLLGKIFWQEIPDVLGTPVEQNFRRAMENRVTVVFELFYPPLNAWFQVRVYPLAEENGISIFTQDITRRKNEEEQIQGQGAIDKFTAAIGNSLTRSSDLTEMLRHCTQSFVDHLDAAFARVWTFNKEENVLELIASSGLYTHTPGRHRRIPVGEFKIGLIASERKPHLTNHVIGDPHVPEQEWAKREGMVAFAGYPLIVEDRLVGVVGIFARKALTEQALQAMSAVANQIAIGIERKRTENALRESESRFRELFSAVPVAVFVCDRNSVIMDYNRRAVEYWGREPKKCDPSERHCGSLRLYLPDGTFLPHEKSPIVEVIHTGNPRKNVEVIVERPDGSRIPVLVNFSPLKNSGGEIIGAITSFDDISERKRAEEALRQSEERLRATFNQAAVGMAVADLDGRFLQVNQRFSEILGYSPGELCRMTFRDLTHPDDLPQTNLTNARLRNGEISHYVLEKRYLRKDGQIVWIRVSVALLKDAAGEAQQFVGVIEDITRRKNAEDQLHETRMRLEATLHAAEIGTWNWDIKNNRLTADRNLARMFSVSEKDAAGAPRETYIKAVHPDDRPKMKAATEASLQSENGSYEVDYRLVQPDGSVRWVVARGKVERDESGKPARMPGVVLDITERKLAEEAGRRSEDELRALANSMPQLAWIAEPDGHIFWYNRGWFDYTGTTLEQMAGWGWQSVHDPKMLPSVVERWKSSISSGEPFEMEFPLRGADGVFRWFLTRVNPVRGLDGRVVRWFGTNTNVDEVKRTRQELQKAKDELEQRVQERTASLQETTEQLETFCYTIAHDLRSPLRAQQTFAQIILEDYKNVLDANGLDYAQRIINSAQRLDKLVNDLLSYSRLSRSELKFEKVDLNRVLQDVQASLADEIQTAGASISVGPLLKVCGHEPTLNLIITNLVVNALKFVEPGVSPQIKIWNESTQHTVRLWVQDNGIGISAENTEKIFGVFQRLHPMDKYPGTGIGLAIVEKGIERMDGHVGLESEIGKGSRFWIELPKVD